MAQASEPSTRTQLVEAGWRLMTARGVAAVTLADVAAAAGVSRQTVYLHFGSRAGLLVEIARHNEVRSPHAALVRDGDMRLGPVASFEAAVRAWFRLLPEAWPIQRALEAAAFTDPGARAAVKSRLEVGRRICRRHLGRIEAAGLLHDDWTLDDAADWVLAQLHFPVWQILVVERGWPPTAFVDRTLAVLTGTLIVDR